MRTATFSDSLLCCGLAETHCRNAWRSICIERMTLVKDDGLLKRRLMDMITSRKTSHSPGKAGVPGAGLGWLTASGAGLFLPWNATAAAGLQQNTGKKPQNAGGHRQIRLPAAKPGSGERRMLLSQGFSWGHLSWWNLFKPSPLEHLDHIPTYRGLSRFSQHSQHLCCLEKLEAPFA